MTSGSFFNPEDDLLTVFSVIPACLSLAVKNLLILSSRGPGRVPFTVPIACTGVCGAAREASSAELAGRASDPVDDVYL